MRQGQLCSLQFEEGAPPDTVGAVLHSSPFWPSRPSGPSISSIQLPLVSSSEFLHLCSACVLLLPEAPFSQIHFAWLAVALEASCPQARAIVALAFVPELC